MTMMFLGEIVNQLKYVKKSYLGTTGWEHNDLFLKCHCKNQQIIAGVIREEIGKRELLS